MLQYDTVLKNAFDNEFQYPSLIDVKLKTCENVLVKFVKG